METNYVAYYRVSTKQQGSSGLGLESQKEIVHSFIRNNGNRILNEFTEVESGRNNNRPQLLKAVSIAKQTGSTLVIAKLDRLSRNMTFISTLMDNKVKFVCCDMPDANELTIHIFASLAQWERKRISERTKNALDAKRKREPDWKPGNPSNLTNEAREKAYSKIRKNAMEDHTVRHAYHYIKLLRKQGLSFHKIADELNSEGYRTRTGKYFHAIQVCNIWKRFSEN